MNRSVSHRASGSLHGSVTTFELLCNFPKIKCTWLILAGFDYSLPFHLTDIPIITIIPQVTADVAASDNTSAASWADELPSTSSRSARLRSLFLYGSPAPPDLEAGSASTAVDNKTARVELTTACERHSPEVS